jgi:hypothetical protein
MDDVRREERREEQLTTADIAGASRPVVRAEEPRAPREDAAGTPVPIEAEEERPTPLFDPEMAGQLRERWTQIQASFVDEPRAAVEQADGLVADAIQRLARTFAGERQNLESRWDRGTDVSTEDLRQALRRYRSFFDRLLNV